MVVHESNNLPASFRKAYRKRLGSPRKIFSWLALQIIRPVSMSTTCVSVVNIADVSKATFLIQEKNGGFLFKKLLYVQADIQTSDICESGTWHGYYRHNAEI